ncbi:MAG TPA: hypothetical protein VH309_02650, partial [Elusimicrobiota bacterium]|nr:hypothetical protein [Elusimicrobiota bacterium]
MKARLALSLLIASLPLRGASAQVETALPAEGAAGGNSSAAAASLDSPPAPVALAVPALSAAPMSAPPPAALAAAPAAAAAPPLSPALAAPADLPLAAASPATEAGPPLHGASASSPRDAASRGADEPSVAQGRALFDAAAPAKDDGSGFWAALKGWAGLGDRLPSWPGAAGEKIRLGGRTFTLGRALAAGADSREWRTERGDDVVKLLRPDPAAAARDRAAAETLRALKGSDIPHAGLIAASADGRALVEEFIEGPGASELLAKGFETRHRLGWAELGARLIRAGVAADLSPGNLVWQHWRTRWTILDASAVEKAAPEKVLSQLLTPAARRAGVDGAEFHAG